MQDFRRTSADGNSADGALVFLKIFIIYIYFLLLFVFVSNRLK